MEAKSINVWRGKSAEARQNYLANDLSILHPEFVHAVNEIKRRMRRCENEKAGAGLILLVPSGAGKTKLCKFLKARWPDEHSETLTKVPVVRFNVPSKPSESSMGQALLHAIGDPAWKRGTSFEIFQRIEHLIPAIGTKLILIDNVQDIPERRGPSGILHVGNWIRDLIDKSQALVVLLGTPAALKIIQANGQLKRRATKRLHIDYFYIDTALHFRRFKKFLEKLFDALPMAEKSELSDELVLEIHDATFGIFDFIIQLFIEAVGYAVEAGRERLIKEDFENAFVMVHKDGVSDRINPFKAGTARRPLTEAGELFHDWFDSSNPPLRPSAAGGHNAT